MKTAHLFVGGALSALFAVGCSSGSGGGGGTVNGLQPPSQVGVVTPAGSTSAPGSVGQGATTSFPAGTDWADDAVTVEVYDPALEPLDLINEILCMMSQTGAAELVNQGAYTAQIDTAVCGAGQNPGASGAGQSAGAGGASFELWTIKSKRPDNRSAQTVDLWVPQDWNGQSATIQVRTRLREGADAQNPFGAFHMDFAAALDVGGSINSPLFTGVLETIPASTGNIGFTFYQNTGDINQVPSVGSWSERVRVNVEMQPDQTSGLAHIFTEQRYDFGMGDSGIQSGQFQVAFNATHFMRSIDGGAAKEYSRSSFDEHVVRYNLYEATGPDAGKRVELNSGFGFSTQAGEFGWIGYYGLWTPPGVSLSDGDTIYRDEYGSSTRTPYTLVTAPGKLIHMTQEQLTLAQIEGEVFEWWEPGTGTRYQLQYSMGIWSEIAVWDDNAGAWVSMAPVAINPATYGFLDLWSNSLGGSVAYLAGDTFVSYFKREFVDGSDPLLANGDVTFYGLVANLRSDITQSEAEAGNVYLPDATSVSAPYEFEFHASDLTLYHDTDGSGTNLTQVGLVAGAAPSSGPNTWGMSSGPLVLSTAGLVDPWDVWNATDFYVYETGHNSWNQYAGVKDSLGVFVDFDAPLQFTYQHETANDRNGDSTYDGKSYLVYYNGPGDLGGWPFAGVDLDGDGNDDRYYPVFDLLDGVLMGPTGVEYAVKAIEVEETLREDPGGSVGLSLSGAAALALPDGTNYAVPDIGTKPVVNDPPRVVAGVIVGGS